LCCLKNNQSLGKESFGGEKMRIIKEIGKDIWRAVKFFPKIGKGILTVIRFYLLWTWKLGKLTAEDDGVPSPLLILVALEVYLILIIVSGFLGYANTKNVFPYSWHLALSIIFIRIVQFIAGLLYSRAQERLERQNPSPSVIRSTNIAEESITPIIAENPLSVNSVDNPLKLRPPAEKEIIEEVKPPIVPTEKPQPKKDEEKELSQKPWEL